MCSPPLFDFSIGSPLRVIMKESCNLRQKGRMDCCGWERDG